MTKSEELKAMLRGEPTISQPNVVTPPTTKSQALRQQMRNEMTQPSQSVVQQPQTMTEKLEANKNIKNPSQRNYLTSPAEIYQLAAEQGKISQEEANKYANVKKPTISSDYAITQYNIKADADKNKVFDDVNSAKYFEYQNKRDEAKKAGDIVKEVSYQGMLDKMDEAYKPMTKDWYNIQKPDTEFLKGQIQNRISDTKWAEKKFSEATTPEEQQKWAENYSKEYGKYQKAVKDYQDALLYQKYNNNPVLDELNVLKYAGADSVANLIEGAAEDIKDNRENAIGVGYDYIKPDRLLDFNEKRKNRSGTLAQSAAPMLDTSLNALRYQAEKENAGEEIKELYKQILSGTYNGTAEDINKILTNEKREQNTYRRREEVQQSLEQRKNEFDWKYEPNPTVQKGLDALEVVTRMLPNQAANLIAPGLGDIVMYETAGNQAQDKAYAEGANYRGAGLNKTLKGSLEAATEHLVTSSIDKAVGRTGLVAPSEWAEHIANPLLRTGVDFGVNVVGEGVEEIPSAILDPVIDRITHNPDAPLATMEDVWGAFRDSLLPSAIMQGAGSAMLAVDNYANKVENRINNSGLTDLQKSELINQVENGRKEFIKQIEQRKNEIDAQATNVAQQQTVQQAEKDSVANEPIAMYSLSEEQQNEVNDYINKLTNDTTIDDNFKDQILTRFDNLTDYKQFENIKQDVEDYKEKAYKGIKSLVDVANMKPEDAKQRPMEYTQRKDKNTPNQRKFFDNVETSSIVADETKSRINPTTYEVKHNLDTLEKMRQRLDERGNDLVEDWKHKSKNFNDNDVALGAILLERYQQQGDWNSAARTAEKLADMSTETARALQMYSIWQRLSPETMQIFTQKQLNEAFEEMKQRKTGKWVEANKDKFKLTAEETQFIYDQVEKASQAIDEETKQRELSKIENMINNKLPPDAGQSIKALRRIAMLFNPKTQVRNIAGNTLIMPVNDVADLVGTAIDKAIAKKTGIRTTSVPNIATKAKGFAKGVGQAIKDYKTGTRTTASGNKYEFDIGAKPFNENTGSKIKNAIARGLNATNDLLSAVMSGGDRPFYEAAYQNSLEGQMKANNVAEPTQEMIDIAVNEALQRTWNDDNNYTKTVLSIRKAMNNINIKGFGLGDLIIPFAKTPANLTKAMVEYSPAGFIESVIDFNDMRKAISRGEMTPMQQKKFVSSTSKAIAGSMLYLIAGSLVKAGKITGSADDDKDVKNFEQNVLGIQPYSVKLGDKTYTYSWANPINAPLAIMADTYKMSKENASKWDILNNAFKVAGETLVDNSFLQGIKELFSKDSISEGIVEAIESFPESLIPTLFSQIASLGDTKQRQTFEYQNDFGTIANKIKNKVPGARNTLAPQVNTFGEEIENQNNMFNAFINPANVREARITDEQKALYDVYQETKDKTIFPMQAPYYTNKDNGEKQNLSSADRTTYQKASGKYVGQAYDGLFDYETFKKLKNEGKVKILHEIATDGNLKGREAVGAVQEATNSNVSKLNERMEELKKADIPLADYYIAWYAKNNLVQGKSQESQRKAIREYTDLTPQQEEVLYGIFNIQSKKGS